MHEVLQVLKVIKRLFGVQQLGLQEHFRLSTKTIIYRALRVLYDCPPHRSMLPRGLFVCWIHPSPSQNVENRPNLTPSPCCAPFSDLNMTIHRFSTWTLTTT